MHFSPYVPVTPGPLPRQVQNPGDNSKKRRAQDDADLGIQVGESRVGSVISVGHKRAPY